MSRLAAIRSFSTSVFLQMRRNFRFAEADALTTKRGPTPQEESRSWVRRSWARSSRATKPTDSCFFANRSCRQVSRKLPHNVPRKLGPRLQKQKKPMFSHEAALGRAERRRNIETAPSVTGIHPRTFNPAIRAMQCLSVSSTARCTRDLPTHIRDLTILQGLYLALPRAETVVTNQKMDRI